MAKSKKIDVKNVILTENDGVFIIKGLEGEEVPFENLTNEIEDMIKLEKPLNIKITKARNSTPGERQPKYKYQCGCENVITSKSESLEIECLVCHQRYEKIDE
jgi:hypothetical protein